MPHWPSPVLPARKTGSCLYHSRCVPAPATARPPRGHNKTPGILRCENLAAEIAETAHLFDPKTTIKPILIREKQPPLCPVVCKFLYHNPVS
jgi:hypothetical protein